MSFSQSSSFSSQGSHSQQPTSTASTQDQYHRRIVLKAEWNGISARLETALRPYVLRYAKLSDNDMVVLVKNAIVEDVDPDHVWFKRGIWKVRNNQSTWKFRTLIAMRHYVTRTIANDTGMLKDTTDQRVLFSHFERIYSIHDAEDGFPWAARFIKFGDSNQKGSKTTPGPFWIKSFFVSLAVKTKLHLDKPRKEGHDRQSLLDFYDQYPTCKAFDRIKPRHFQLKPVRPQRKSRPKKLLAPETMVFGQLSEEMVMDSLSESDREIENNPTDGLDDDE